MSVTAAAIVGGTLVSGYLSSEASSDAASASQAGTEAAAEASLEGTRLQIAEIQRQFDYQMSVLQPQIQQQYNAQRVYSNLLGIGGPSLPPRASATTGNPELDANIRVKNAPGTNTFDDFAQNQGYQQEYIAQQESELARLQAALQAEENKKPNNMVWENGKDSNMIPVGGPDQAVIDDLRKQIGVIETDLGSGNIPPNPNALAPGGAGTARFPGENDVTHFGGDGQPFVDPNLDPTKLAEGAAGTSVYGKEFEVSPGYNFMVEEQNRALERVGSRGGPNIGGRAIMEAQRRAKGLAAGEYYNWASGRERDLHRLGVAEASDLTRGDQSYYNYLNAVGNMAGFGGGPALTAVNTAGSAGTAAASAHGNNAITQATLAVNQGVTDANLAIGGNAALNNAIQGGINNYITASQAGMLN